MTSVTNFDFRNWSQICILLCITNYVVQPSPSSTPALLACKSLLEKSSECQITYTGWKQLKSCLKGAPVYVPDIEQTITCTCASHVPSAVSSADLEFDSFTPPASPPGPPVAPEQDETFPAKAKVGAGLGLYPSRSSGQRTPSDERQHHQGGRDAVSGTIVARGDSLADFDYVAPDGSVAMASRAQYPGVAGLALVVLAVLVLVLLGVVAVLCLSRRSAAGALESDEESEEGEDGAEEGGEGGEGAEEGGSQDVKEDRGEKEYEARAVKKRNPTEEHGIEPEKEDEATDKQGSANAHVKNTEKNEGSKSTGKDRKKGDEETTKSEKKHEDKQTAAGNGDEHPNQPAAVSHPPTD